MWRDIVERWHALSKEQKLALAVIGVAGISVLGLSLQRIQNQINAPFLVPTSSLEDAKKIVGLSEEEQEAQRRRLDTDGDGLSDWDEENSFRTNPYMRDSCGDGISDNIRVLTRRNLACLNSKNPQGSLDLTGVMPTSSDIFSAGTAANYSLAGAASGSPVGDIGLQAMQGMKQAMLARDPEAIREELRDKVPPEELATLSDEELLALYDAALMGAEQQTQPNQGYQEPPADYPLPADNQPAATSSAPSQSPETPTQPTSTGETQPGLKEDWKGSASETPSSIEIK